MSQVATDGVDETYCNEFTYRQVKINEAEESSSQAQLFLLNDFAHEEVDIATVEAVEVVDIILDWSSCC